MRVFKHMKGVQILKKRPPNVIPFPIAVGQVTSAPDATTREVKVIKMEMNDYLKMYFNKSYIFNTVDFNSTSKKGDIVLVRKLENPPTQTKLFGIEQILFQIDNIIDPLTGKKITFDEEEIKKHLENISKSFQ